MLCIEYRRIVVCCPHGVGRPHFNLIINYLTENGVMDPGRLYDRPFTDNAPHGPESRFASADVDRLVEILQSTEAAAEAPTEAA